MRIPIPIVILLSILLIAGLWWWNTRTMDFLTPPSETALAKIREEVQASIPQPERRDEPTTLPEKNAKVSDLPVPGPDLKIEAPTGILLGDVAAPPTLQAYSERLPDGPEKIIELASLLETEGEFQRALLAWERVLDLVKANPEQTTAALNAVRRLRPTLPDWNTDPEKAIPVVLHAGTGPELAKDLKPVLEQAALDLQSASSGILKVTSHIAVGRRTGAKNVPTPVALWLGGSGPDHKEAPSTDVLSFTVTSPELLRAEVFRTSFLLISGQLKRSSTFTEPLPPMESEDPLDAIRFHITRLSWEKFGQSLNPAPEPVAEPIPRAEPVKEAPVLVRPKVRR